MIVRVAVRIGTHVALPQWGQRLGAGDINDFVPLGRLSAPPAWMPPRSFRFLPFVAGAGDRSSGLSFAGRSLCRIAAAARPSSTR